MTLSKPRRSVLFLTNLPVPYRVHFFNLLGQTCRLTVCFERRTASDRGRTWLSEPARSFSPIFMDGVRTGADTALCPSVVRHVLSRAHDVVVVGGYATPTAMLAIEAMRMRGAPFYLNCDGGIPPRDSPAVRALKRHLVGSARWGLASGAGAERYLRSYAPGISEIYRYPFTSVRATDVLEDVPTREEKRRLRSRFGFGKGPLAICVGRFVKWKRFDFVVDAWSEMPDSWSLAIVGEGPEGDSYREMAAAGGLRNVHVLPFKPRDELEAIYRAADVLVLPSSYEPWGLVINEALARGVPVVASDRCGAALELLGDGVCGMHRSIQKPQDIREAVVDLLSDDRGLLVRGRAAIALSRNWTIEEMARRHAEVLGAL